MPPDDLYRRDTWSNLCVKAGILAPHDDPDRYRLAKGFRRLAHLSGSEQIQTLLGVFESRNPETASNAQYEKLLTMLYLSLWGSSDIQTIRVATDRLYKNPRHLKELIELLHYKHDKIAKVSPQLTLPFNCPLEVYCSYTRDEVLAALEYWKLDQNRLGQREGVLYLREFKTDIFFVTLNKTEKHYSPSTMYEDYAISDHLFHWQSQSNTSSTSSTGQRYINHTSTGNTVLLFVREEKSQNGIATPYYFLGPLTYQSHTGSKPISIIWRTHFPIPAFLTPMTQRLAVG